MKPAAGSPEREALHGCDNSTGHLESGGEPEPRCNYKKRTIVLTAAVFFGLLIAVIVLAVSLSEYSVVLGPWCPDDWIGYRGKCYYFSDTEGNWTYSQSQCSAPGASLAGIDSEQEMAFLLHYKGRFDHWIGLRRDPGQPWKWANGTEFNNTFPITADGNCAYLTDQNTVSSLRCTSERHWICSKPDAFTKTKGADKKSIVEISPEKNLTDLL